MTQFRAIFSDEDPLVTPVASGRAEPVSQSLIFHSWVLQKISQFLATLEHDLHGGAGGRLDSILGQCMYFGLSFSRVGADFRGLLAPIFERAARDYFCTALREANKRFEENMQSYNLLGLTTTGSLPFGTSHTQSGQLYPPTSLIDFYPLAAYCNHVLAAFNDLRLCSPLTLACHISDEVQRSLLEVNRVILAFYRAEETTFNDKERDQFEQLCACYVTDLLPYLNKCLQSLFPPTQVAQAMGVSVMDMARKSPGLCQVDITSVLSNISHLMPAAPTPDPVPDPVNPDPSTDPDGSSDSASQGRPVTFMLDSDDEDDDKEDDQSATPTPSTDATPASTDATPASTDATPASTDAMPASIDAMPTSTDAAPASTDAAPASTDATPASTDAPSASTDALTPSTDDTQLSGTDAPMAPGPVEEADGWNNDFDLDNVNLDGGDGWNDEGFDLDSVTLPSADNGGQMTGSKAGKKRLIV